MNISRLPLERRVEKKLISKNQKGDLIIYNYTTDCQWQKAWDKYTMMARGLILKTDGTVVARPFPKFFNLEEQFGADQMKQLPKYMPEIVEKLDGSLGILYKQDGELFIATRGSFESEQAVWATKWLREHMPKEELRENITYLFEIIYPMNRIVVDYKDRAELVLLRLVHNYTGKILSYLDLKREAERQGWNYVKRFTFDVNEVLYRAKNEIKGLEEEGYVLFYENENLMLKVKLLDYVRLHRLTFGITVKSIWENMMYGQNIQEIFADAPDEVMDWITFWEEKIGDAVKVHIYKAQDAYEEVRDMPTRRDQALWLRENAPAYMPAVFGLLDGKTWKESLYKMVRPTKEESAQQFRVLRKEDV